MIPEFGIDKELPAGQTTAVEFTPNKAGTHRFTCPMGMYDGQLVVEE